MQAFCQHVTAARFVRRNGGSTSELRLNYIDKLRQLAYHAKKIITILVQRNVLITELLKLHMDTYHYFIFYVNGYVTWRF